MKIIYFFYKGSIQKFYIIVLLYKIKIYKNYQKPLMKLLAFRGTCIENLVH
jgi:hypothetical protein